MQTIGWIHHKSGHRVPVRTWATPLRDKRGSIIGIIQTFETEFAVACPDPNDRSTKERGCLDDVTGLPNQGMMQSHLRESWEPSRSCKFPLASFVLRSRNSANSEPGTGRKRPGLCCR